MKNFTKVLATFFIVCSIYSLSFAADKVVVIPLDSNSASSVGTTVFFSGFNSTGTFATQIRYAGIAGQSAGSSEDGHFFPMTQNATVANFTLLVTTNTLSSGETMTITLQKNGVNTAITHTFNSSTSTGSYTVSGTVAYAAGDTFSIPVVASASASGQTYVSGAFDITY